MDFTIDGELLSFNDSVVPAIGEMQSTAEDYIERFQNVADGAMTFNGDLTGNYESNSSGQFIIAGEIENTSCLGEVDALEGQLVPILTDCENLGKMIEELIKLKEKGEKLQQEIASNNAEISRLQNQTDENGNITASAAQKISSLQEENRRLEEELKKVKEEFDKLHQEAKQLLSSLKGSDVSLPEVPVLSGTLSFEPSMSALSAKGNAGYKSDFYNYQVGDQSIASISQ